jgi:glycosyltransferase involved in cell wall biosynthesis
MTQEYRRGATWIYCYNLAKEFNKENEWKAHVISALKKKQKEVFSELDALRLINTSSSKYFYSRDYWKKSRALVNQINPTIVHGNMNMLSSLGIKESYPVVETIHTTFSREKMGTIGMPFRSLTWVEKRVVLLYKLLKRKETQLLQRAKHLIAVSDAIKEELIGKYSINSDKITSIPNGVDIDTHYRTNEKIYDKNEDEFILGFLGRMTIGKGAKLLLPILRKVKKEIPNIKLLTAGDDLNTKGEIIQLIQDYGLSENIVDFGYIYDIQKKNSFFSSLDIFLLPSSHEGMNLTLLEALACQTPVLTTKEAITFEHDNTFVTTTRNVKDMADKVIELYNSPNILAKIRRKSRFVAEKYTWKNTAKLTKKVYDDILAS